MCLQLQSEILLLDSLVLLIHPTELLLHLGHVVLRLLENRFIILKVALESLHFAFNRSDLTLHLQDFGADLVGPTVARISSVFGDSLL